MQKEKKDDYDAEEETKRKKKNYGSRTTLFTMRKMTCEIQGEERMKVFFDKK